jgi:hypothetical protein
MIICVAIPVFLFTTQDFRMKEKKRPVLTFLSLRNILVEHFSFEHQVNYILNFHHLLNHVGKIKIFLNLNWGLLTTKVGNIIIL